MRPPTRPSHRLIVTRRKSFSIIGAILFFWILLPVYFTGRSASIEAPPIQNSILLACQKEARPSERLRCLMPYFETLTREGSAQEAIDAARKLQQEKIIDDCHLPAHYIGRENLRKNNQDVARAFSTCSAGCMEGCYHGVMEEYLSQNPDLDAFIKQLPHFCDSVSSDLKQRRQCLHGVGHGLLSRDISLLEAVTLCRGIDDAYSIKTCIGGVMMQNMNNIMLSDELTFRNKLAGMCAPIDPLQDMGLKNLCLEQVGEGIMFYTGHDFIKSEEYCRELAPEDRPHCFRGADVERGRHESGMNQ